MGMRPDLVTASFLAAADMMDVRCEVGIKTNKRPVVCRRVTTVPCLTSSNYNRVSHHQWGILTVNNLKLGVISRLYNGTALTIADTVAYYLLLQSIDIPS